jgi:hypothetical protein
MFILLIQCQQLEPLPAAEPAEHGVSQDDGGPAASCCAAVETTLCKFVCVWRLQQGDNSMEIFWLFKMAAALPIQHF